MKIKNYSGIAIPGYTNDGMSPCDLGFIVADDDPNAVQVHVGDGVRAGMEPQLMVRRSDLYKAVEALRSGESRDA